MCKSSFLVRNPRAGIAGQREFLPVPCGKCPKCVASRINGWVWRMEQELKVSSSPFFVTLTYDEDNVPFDNLIYNDDGTASVQLVLRPRDLTLYIKKLRKAYAKSNPNVQLRYFAVGEYGKRTRRPHYHIVLLNCDDIRLIQDTWGKGHVDVSPMRAIESVVYCLKYLHKRDSYRPDGAPSFNRMSKGLGRNYLNPEVKAFHNRSLDNCTVTLNSNVVIPVPKYFKERIYSDYQRWKLTNHLQQRHDKLQEERVQSIISSTNDSESNILHSIYSEPYLNPFSERLVKPTIF